MKKFLLTITFLFLLSTSCFAMESALINEIPGKYVLFAITNVEKEIVLDKEVLLPFLEKNFPELNVDVLQYAAWEEGKSFGDGVLLFGELTRLENKPFPYTEAENASAGKVLELLIGWKISPIEVYSDFAENVVAAEAMYKGNPLIFKVKVSGVSKDLLGKTYMSAPLDSMGMKNLQFYLDETDPLVLEIKKGSTVTVNAYTDKFLLKDLYLNATLMRVENE